MSHETCTKWCRLLDTPLGEGLCPDLKRTITVICEASTLSQSVSQRSILSHSLPCFDVTNGFTALINRDWKEQFEKQCKEGCIWCKYCCSRSKPTSLNRCLHLVTDMTPLIPCLNNRLHSRFLYSDCFKD